MRGHVQFRLEEAADWGEEIEATEKIPEALWNRIRELGFHKLTQPQWAGGEGLPLSLYFPILEEFARCHGSIRMIVHAIQQHLAHDRARQRRTAAILAAPEARAGRRARRVRANGAGQWYGY